MRALNCPKCNIQPREYEGSYYDDADCPDFVRYECPKCGLCGPPGSLPFGGYTAKIGWNELVSKILK